MTEDTLPPQKRARQVLTATTAGNRRPGFSAFDCCTHLSLNPSQRCGPTTNSRGQRTFLVDPAAYERVKKSTMARLCRAHGSGYRVGLRIPSVMHRKVGIRFMNIRIPVCIHISNAQHRQRTHLVELRWMRITVVVVGERPRS